MSKAGYERQSTIRNIARVMCVVFLVATVWCAVVGVKSTADAWNSDEGEASSG